MAQTGTSDMPTDFALRRFTVDEYYRIYYAGIIGRNERVELIDGAILEMAPIGDGHSSITVRLNAVLNARLYPRALVTVQTPIVLGEFSEPEPDVGVVAYRADFYASGKPSTADTFALIEVSDTSLAFDRGKKLRTYAQARIPEYWIANVSAKALEVYREPNDDGYSSRKALGPRDSVAFLAFPDDVFLVSDLIG